MKGPRQRGVFVTGTDTGVGKTFIIVGLIGRLARKGIKTEPRKPVESGCRRSDIGLLPADALAMQGATAGNLPLQEICRYRLEHPLSPERAAALEGMALTLRMLEEACRRTHGHYLIVEGAGGFYSPIASDGLNADLAERLGLPILLVAPDRLGCINQVLLSAEAIASRGLNLLAVALNRWNGPVIEGMDNAEDLRRRMECPIVIIPYENQGTSHSGLSQLVDVLTESHN